jgi:hypothetical protein
MHTHQDLVLISFWLFKFQNFQLVIFYYFYSRLLKLGFYTESVEGFRRSNHRIGSWIVRSYLFVGKSVKTY